MTLDTVVRCRFLGHAQIEIGHTLVTPEAERLFALLMVLACDAGRALNREELARLLWPDVPEDRAKHNLRQSIYKARQSGAHFEASGDEIRLPKAAVWRDWDQPRMPVHGEWLGAYTAAFSDALAVWVLERRVAVHAALRPRMVFHMQSVRSAGDVYEAGRLAEQILRIDPLNEEAVLVTAESYAMAGAKVEALGLLDDYIKEVGRISDSAELLMPAKVLRSRIAERLPVASYASGGLPDLPLIGRDRELKLLIAALFDIRGGRGASTWLWGSEGIGKSRLVQEQLKAATIQGVRVIREQSTPDESRRAGRLVSLLKRLLDTPGALGISPSSMGLLLEVVERGQTFDSTNLGPAFVELVRSLAEEQPLYVVLDGVDNWTTDEITTVCQTFREAGTAEAGLLLVSRQNPATLGPRLAPTSTRTIALMRLSTDETLELLEQRALQLHRVLDSGALLGPVMASEGIPGFAFEFLGQLLNPADGDAVPFRVRSALLRSIEKLQHSHLHMLAAIWAAGGEATEDALAGCAQVNLLSARESISALIDHNLVVQRTSGYSVCRAVEAIATEIIPQCCENPFLISCAEALRQTAKERNSTRLLFRAYFLMTKASHTALVANWVTEDLAQVLSQASAGTILDSIDWLDETVGLSGELSVLRHIANEVRIRAGNYSSARKPLLESAEIAATLPSTPAEEIAYYNKVIGIREYESAMASAVDVTRPQIDRIRATTQAIVIADNLQQRSLVLNAARVLNVIGGLEPARSIDVVRGRLIAACVVSDRGGVEEHCQQLTALASNEADRSEACKALRTVHQARMAMGDLVEARSAILDSIKVARASEFWNHVVLGEQCLSFLSIAAHDAFHAEAHLREATSLCRLHAVETPMILFDNQLAAVWCSILSEDMPNAAKEFKKLELLGSSSDSTGTKRQLAFLRFALTEPKETPHSTGERGVEALTMALSLGEHRPDDREDRNAFLLKVATPSLADGTRIQDALAHYVMKKIALGYKATPLTKALTDS
jgi:hypothetical protein